MPELRAPGLPLSADERFVQLLTHRAARLNRDVARRGVKQAYRLRAPELQRLVGTIIMLEEIGHTHAGISTRAAFRARWQADNFREKLICNGDRDAVISISEHARRFGLRWPTPAQIRQAQRAALGLN
jgi:hypothetical protein